MTRIAIIDDEADARHALRSLLSTHCPEVEIIGEATGVADATQLIRQQHPSVLLLDIAMQDGTGFDLLDQFPQPPFKVIFTTAFDQFAIKAFRYNAMDYLLKPIDPDELVSAIEKLETTQQEDYTKKIAGLLESTRQKQFERITLSSLDGLVFLRLEEIVHLEADGNYTTFYLLDGEKHVVVRNIKEYENLLPSELFFRTHQSHIVNLNFVKKFKREEGGFLRLVDGRNVPVARRRKDVLVKILREMSL